MAKLNLNIRGIQHIGIPVTDIKTSEKFYSHLGFENVMNSVFDSGGGKGKVIMMKMNSMIIELYEMPAAELEEIRNRKDGHIDHIAFDVPDVDKVFNTLKKSGFNIEDEEPLFLDFWEKGCRYFSILGPDKERLEFNQLL